MHPFKCCPCIVPGDLKKLCLCMLSLALECFTARLTVTFSLEQYGRRVEKISGSRTRVMALIVILFLQALSNT